MPHDDHSHDHSHGDVHTHPRRRFKATVDHLANDYTESSKLLVAIDAELMHGSGLAPDDIVRIATERGSAHKLLQGVSPWHLYCNRVP